MEIVVKVTKPSLREAVKHVTDLLGRALSEDDAKRASVTPVFPDVTKGRRAGMLTLSLHGGTSSESAGRVLEALRSSDAVEYAQETAERTPRTGAKRRS